MVWKDIPGFEGRYRVSECGKVMSLLHGAKTLKQAGNGGYLFVHLRKDGKGYTLRVHCLVALAFIGPRPFPGAEVRHLNNNRLDNLRSNLEYGTRKENQRDSYPVLLDRQKIQAKRLLLQGYTQKEIASVMGVGIKVIGQLAKELRKSGEVAIPAGRNWNVAYINHQQS